MTSSMSLLPPAPDVCQLCARAHPDEVPHDKSLYFGSRFMLDHGREPTWADAMAHCTEDVRASWTKILTEQHGIDVGTPMSGRLWGPAVERLFAWSADPYALDSAEVNA